MEIRNRESVFNELYDLIIGFECDMNQYQTDVYAYVDSDGNVTLDTFVNVGGNSWLNDDHITIYTDKQHYEDAFSYCESEDDLAYFCEMSVDELKKLAFEANKECYDSIEEVTYADIVDVIKDSEQLLDTFNESAKYCIKYEMDKDHITYAVDAALEIIENI